MESSSVEIVPVSVGMGTPLANWTHYIKRENMLHFIHPVKKLHFFRPVGLNGYQI
jgi:hypothetical protein